MIHPKKMFVCAALFLLVGNSCPAADATNATNRTYVPVLRINSDKDAYLLKVGHPTFDSFINATSAPAFTNFAQALKRLSGESRPRRTSGPTAATNWLRPIDVDIALGSDYQVFNWLETARIDAAMICPTAFQLHSHAKRGVTNLVCLASPVGIADRVAYQPKLRSFRYVGRAPQTLANPEIEYLSFLESIAQTNLAPAKTYRLISPSHLSAAGFMAPVAYADHWFKNFSATTAQSRAATSNFWRSFFARLEFALGSTSHWATVDRPEQNVVVIEFAPDTIFESERADEGWNVYTNTARVAWPWLTNMLVVRRGITNKLVAPQALNQWVPPASLDPAVESLLTNADLQPFLQPAFSMTEAVRFLRADQESSQLPDLSLVLSGGGVKAAYQSRLIDHLYLEKKLLKNSTNGPAAALHVKSIAGNSGGALLGYFVAGLETNDTRQLATSLWRTPKGEVITDRNIFAFWDLPRWASFVICIWIFIGTLRLWSFFTRQPGTSNASNETPEKSHTLAWRYRLAIILVLAVTPCLLKLVNGDDGKEHIPAIEGLFYFICLALVLLLDNCIAPPAKLQKSAELPAWIPLWLRNRFRSTDKPALPAWTGWHRPLSFPTGLLIFGAIVALVPAIWFEIKKQASGNPGWVVDVIFETDNSGKLDLRITKGGFICCMGMLLFWGGAIWRLLRRSERCDFQTWRCYVRALLLGVVVIGLSYISLKVLEMKDVVTFLELTPGFWFRLGGITFAISSVYFLIGNCKKCPGWMEKVPGGEWVYGCVCEAMKFQLQSHPSGALRLRRFARMHLIFTLGFLYWNVVVAPGLYGNARARYYLEQTDRRFAKRADGKTNDYALQTLYAAPANDLERKRERYFLFYPSNEQSIALSSLRTKLKNDAFERWSVYPFLPTNASHMRDVVFASGSPFPIFSPHKVASNTDEEAEWLVDGGYAHNVPLEAARELGARQVLLLNSSPDEIPTTNTNRFELGQLSRNLPRLLPFLFNHSQVADLLIREEMCIVSLAPAPDEKWPSLFDFRRRMVEMLLERAQADADERIGRIVTCGPPVFLISIRMGRE
jgi:predicted acylesterase/phospholipase RssA